MDQTVFTQLKDIPGFDSWKIIEPITKGWSHDLKYFVIDNQGAKFLLRISALDHFNKYHFHYEKLLALNRIELSMSKLIVSGVCNRGQNGYRLFTWIDGSDLTNKIQNFSTSDQYNLGLKAGQILHTIHQTKPAKNYLNWNLHYGQKIDSKLALYRKCNVRLAKEEKLLDYINQHRLQIKNRPVCFQHGDYHIRNMLITTDHRLAVIDFDRLDFGDPWEEFNRIIWTASLSPAFACGQIDGYFGDDVPKSFFELLALYMCVNQVGSIPWAQGFGEEEVETAIEKTAEVLEWFDDFEVSIPKWYKKK